MSVKIVESGFRFTPDKFVEGGYVNDVGEPVDRADMMARIFAAALVAPFPSETKDRLLFAEAACQHFINMI